MTIAARPTLYHLNHGCNDYRPGLVLSLRPFVVVASDSVAGSL